MWEGILTVISLFLTSFCTDQRVIYQDVVLKACRACVVPEKCEVVAVRCAPSARLPDTCNPISDTQESCVMSIGGLEIWAEVECIFQSLEYCDAEPLALSVEACSTGWWSPVSADSSYSMICTKNSCSRSFKDCLDIQVIKRRLSEAIDFSDAECNKMTILGFGYATGRSCDWRTGCSHSVSCEEKITLEDIHKGIEFHYYSGHEQEWTLPALPERTTVVMEANAGRICWSDEEGNSVCDGEEPSRSCWARCGRENFVIDIPSGKRGKLRAVFVIGAACGNNMVVRIAASPKIQAGQFSGSVTLEAQLSWGKVGFEDNVERTESVVSGLLRLAQTCTKLESNSKHTHNCTVTSDKICCSIVPDFIYPENWFNRNGDCWQLDTRPVLSEKCLLVTIVSAIQESVQLCYEKGMWVGVKLDINSTITAPPNSQKWPETVLPKPVCSFFSMDGCSGFKLVLYILIWAGIIFLIVWLVIKLLKRFGIDLSCLLPWNWKCCCKNKHSPDKPAKESAHADPHPAEISIASASIDLGSSKNESYFRHTTEEIASMI